MLSLIVKGNKFQAAQAAADRGIPFAFQTETKAGETVGHVGEQYMDKVMAWFCEPGTAPYPVGACLLYSTVREGQEVTQRGPSDKASPQGTRAEHSRIVEARCTRHGVVASGPHWTPVAVRGSIHATGDCAASVRIEWVMDYADWQAIHPDYRSWTDTVPSGTAERRALHRDQYGDTLSVPVRIRDARGAA